MVIPTAKVSHPMCSRPSPVAGNRDRASPGRQAVMVLVVRYDLKQATVSNEMMPTYCRRRRVRDMKKHPYREKQKHAGLYRAKTGVCGERFIIEL